MATEGSHGHEAVLARIGNALASDPWDTRLAVIELVDGLLGDLPSERTVERLVEILDRLAQDSKWEVRRAVVPVLVKAGRPAARRVVERLTSDDNQWVRQAAERAKRKLARLTTVSEKLDKRARFAFETIRDLDGTSAPRIYQAAIRVGEKYYEELAGDTAHELNTYRASIEGLLQELEFRIVGSSGATPGVTDIFRKIHERSRYLRALVSGLVEYSRDAELQFQVHPLGPILTEALDLAREKAGASLAGHDVETIVTIAPVIHLEACRERLLQALVNILSNAFESLAGTEHPGRVVIDAQTNGGDSLCVTVVDTGIGMDAAQVESATKRFRSLRKERGGIGLGLPLAVKIIEQEHAGRLEIESTVGVGTTVTIEVPLKHGAP
jgi:signal transduction histidine kinase